MRLIIVRHGKAHRDAPDGTDASRTLTARGKRQAQWLAQSILEIARGKPLLLTSPITRAISTAQPIATALGLTPVIDERLATDSTVRACIEAIDDTATEHAPGTLIIVGHNPHFEALASALLSGGSEFRAMRTGEACVMDIETPIRRSSGQLESWLRLDDEEAE